MEHNISPENLHKYLQINSWTLGAYNDKFDRASKQYDGESFDLVIPKTKDLPEFESRVRDILNSLGALENCSPTVIAEKIANIGYDLMKIRFIAAETKEGTIPLQYFIGAINNVKQFLTYGACAEIQPKSQYRGKIFEDAKHLIDNCQFAQTEIGSFKIIIRVPLGKTYLPSIDEDNEYLRDLGRRTIVRLIEGIREAEQLPVEDENIFRETYNKKLNRNVCDAITKMISREDGFDLEITTNWDGVQPPMEELDSEAEIQAQTHFRKFTRMASWLKKINEDEDTTIRGYVEKLHLRGRATPSESRLITIDVPSLKRKVYLHLNPDDYHTAVQSHDPPQMVEVIGRLNKKTQHWVLDNPTNFRVVRAKDQR